MKFCSKCKKEYLELHNFCRDCGSKLKNKKEPECPKFNYPVFGKFCSECGHKFDEKLLKKTNIKI